MKLLLIVISKDDSDAAVAALAKIRISAGVIASCGSSFFGDGRSTLIAICKDSQLDDAVKAVREAAGPVRKTLPGASYTELPTYSEEGGGIICVLNADSIIQL